MALRGRRSVVICAAHTTLIGVFRILSVAPPPLSVEPNVVTPSTRWPSLRRQISSQSWSARVVSSNYAVCMAKSRSTVCAATRAKSLWTAYAARLAAGSIATASVVSEHVRTTAVSFPSLMRSAQRRAPGDVLVRLTILHGLVRLVPAMAVVMRHHGEPSRTGFVSFRFKFNSIGNDTKGQNVLGQSRHSGGDPLSEVLNESWSWSSPFANMRFGQIDPLFGPNAGLIRSI
jgi:hypothetical protein